MKKRNNIGILLLVLLISFAFSLFCVMLMAEEKESFEYDPHERRNPFWPLVDNNGSIVNYDNDFMITDMHLDGIMLESNGNNIAIINGQIAKVNDIVGKYKLISIEPNRVILVKDDKQYELKLKKEE